MTVEPNASELREHIAALEGRLRQLEDEREIRELLARYGYYADSCRDEDYLELWTDDGVMDLSMGTSPFAHDGVQRWEGTDRLRTFIEDPAGHHSPGFYGYSSHLQGNNVVIAVDGDDAVATAYSVLLQQDGPTTRIVGGGTNRWTLRREHGRWRIKERRRREIGHADTAGNLAATDPAPATTPATDGRL